MIVPVASVALADVVVPDKTAAVSNVAATLVVVILAPVVMIRWIPAAAASVALVIAAARVTPAVEEPAEFAVTIWTAMTLQRKNVVEMEMVTYVILIRRAVAFIAVVKLGGSAVMASAVRRANAATRAYAKHLKDVRAA